MAIVTGDRYLENLLHFLSNQSSSLLDGSLTLKLNPVGLHYVQSRLETLHELETLLAGAPVDYLRAYISDLGDHRALEQLRRILGLIPRIKIVSVLPKGGRDPTPLCLLPFGRLRVLELRGCDLSTSAARGLVELRGTMEKMIIHNSTDALRHVFASRIVDIKDSPLWNKLAMLSCPCNGLVLMDESLQLLPGVETLDLSRNRFAKVDNLRRCTKLKHLDLGFNHLRSISSLGEVGYSIVKLVLRNNALTSLRGIETFTSLEGLDLSYNIISNISELEILSSLPSLQSLWLEGNPICCAPWYRAQVFSLFVQPENLELDDKRITTRESWKRQIVLASRIKRPAGFGFYSPAKDNDEVDGSVNKNRKKPSRLASIEEQRSGSFLEAVQQDSASCGSDIQGREEVPVSEGEAEIFDLMNRVEFLKKEHSVLWLREFKEWMDQSSENLADGNELTGLIDPGRENYKGNREDDMQHGESSVHVSDMLHTIENDVRTDVFDSDNSYGDSSMYHNHMSDSEIAFLESPVGEIHEESVPDLQNGNISLGRVQEKDPSEPHFNDLPMSQDSLVVDTLTSSIGIQTSKEASLMQATSIDEMMEPTLSFSYAGSPPHFQEDILQRRQNLEEEFMQLSVKSFSLASSDSDTSTSDDEFCKYYTSSPERPDASHAEELSHTDQICTDNNLVNGDSCSIDNGGKQESGFWERMTRKTRLRKRVVSLSEEKSVAVNGQPLALEQNGTTEVDVGDETPDRNIDGSDFPGFLINECSSSTLTATTKAQHVTEEVIKNYFHSNISKSNVSETCVRSILCDCVLPKESEYKESEVAIVLSDADKIYLLLVATTSDGSEIVLETIGCYVLDEIDEVVIAIGLQVLRVHIETGATYLFKTRSVEKSRELLTLLSICDSTSNRCSLISAEKVQVELFEKYICRDTKVGIFMYSMLLFWCTQNEEKLWLSRSLFVIEGYLIICIEDLVHFGDDDTFSSSYFSLDSCCSLNHITEMVIEPRDTTCATLTLDYDKLDPKHRIANEKMVNHLNTKMATGSHKWRLKWFSEEILLKFVALLKALHANTAMHPLTVRYETHL